MQEIIIIIVLILLNGIFSMSEIALVSARKSRLAADAKNGNKSAKTALRLVENPDNFLSTVQIGITLIGILTGIFSGATIAVIFASWLEEHGISSNIAITVAKTTIVVLVTYLTLVFGELLPKRIGMSKSEKIARITAHPMYLLSKIMSPFVILLSGSTSLLFRIIGLKTEKEKVTEEEIKSIVKEGAEYGVVQPVEQNLVERVFLLGDLNVDSIMTPRNDIVWMYADMSAQEIGTVLSESLFEFYPINDPDTDKLLGVVTLKQLVLNIAKPVFNIRDIITEPMYFYENTKVYKVMELMRDAHASRGLVVDEFGECIGIVTLKDILDGLVGNMPHEDDEAAIIKRENHDGWLVDGQCSMLDFLTYFDEKDAMHDEEFNTVAGLCIHELKHIPARGEHFIWKTFEFEIMDVDHARIDSILVKKL